MAELNWLALAIGAPLALVFTLGVRTLAARQGWMDRPGAARIHAVPVPRLGGVAMYAAFVITVLVVAWPLDGPTLGLLLGATLLVVFIVVDDLRGMRPRDKFLAQLAAAAVPLVFGVRIDAVSNPFEVGVVLLHVAIVIPFTLFWITGMMNAINFVDGLDGLAGGVVTIAAIVLIVLSMRLGLPETATLALVLVAVVLGFLPFNAYRSSIIMGDAGSHFLGFALAVIAIMGPAKLATAILVLGVPILDIAWSIGRRLASGRRFADRDAEHLHHRLWEAGVPQPAIALMYYTLAGVLGVIALMVERLDKIFAFLGLAAFLGVLLAILSRAPRRRGIPRR